MDVTDLDKTKGLKTPLPSWVEYERECTICLPTAKMGIIER